MRFKVGRRVIDEKNLSYKGKSLERTDISLEKIIRSGIKFDKRTDFYKELPQIYDRANNIRLPSGEYLLELLIPRSRSSKKGTITESRVRRLARGRTNPHLFQKNHYSEWVYAFMHKSKKGNYSLLKELFPSYNDTGITEQRVNNIKDLYETPSEFFTDDPYYGGFAIKRGVIK